MFMNITSDIPLSLCTPSYPPVHEFYCLPAGHHCLLDQNLISLRLADLLSRHQQNISKLSTSQPVYLNEFLAPHYLLGQLLVAFWLFEFSEKGFPHHLFPTAALSFLGEGSDTFYKL